MDTTLNTGSWHPTKNLLFKQLVLKPTGLIMTARRGDLVGEARAAEREAAARNGKINADHLEIALNAMEHWWAQIQLPMAIAWRRWRDRA